MEKTKNEINADIMSIKGFPFKCTLSLKLLIEFWENEICCINSAYGELYEKNVKEKISGNLESYFNIENIEFLNANKHIIDTLMSVIFPLSTKDKTIIACTAPFARVPFHYSEAFKHIFFHKKNLKRGFDKNKDHMKHLIQSAYKPILEYIYNLNIDQKASSVYEIEDTDTGFIKYYTGEIDSRYCDIIPLKEIPVLDDETKIKIIENFDDLDFIMKVIPPDCFEFSGFLILRINDITEQELISSIKSTLLESDSLLSENRFSILKEKFSQLLRIEDLNFGLATVREEKVLILNDEKEIKNNCIFQSSKHYQMNLFKKSIYEKAVLLNKNIIISDLKDLTIQSPIEKELLESGIRNIMIAPLKSGNDVLGIISLFSKKPHQLNRINTAVLDEIYPLLTTAIKRSLDSFESDIQNIIQNHFTAIHPSIFWKFKNAAINFFESMVLNNSAEMEKIVFSDVFPLYCITDIRGSSTQRNLAIQQDLTRHLTLAKEILLLADNIKPLPIIDELIFRIDNDLNAIKENLDSGEEISIMHFLRNDVESSFKYFIELSTELKNKITDYQNLLHSESGTLYEKRKDFDDSVTMINQTVSQYIDDEQVNAQKMFPHYFEKNTTDGVDQTIYIGQSLVHDKKFSKLYLKNLRLWQLITLCKIGQITHNLKPRLKVKLDTTHLVVVQDMPITISFSFDEKKLHVDGAYNIRYEIMKKRIDKAVIIDTGERLTQPGMIAIVYTQNSEAEEYKQYITYLQEKGFLEDILEEHILEDVQGIKGLRALRVKIKINHDTI